MGGDALFPWLDPAALGLVWCIGRVIYAIGYMKEANKRGPGFGIAASGIAGAAGPVDLGRGGKLDGRHSTDSSHGRGRLRALA